MTCTPLGFSTDATLGGGFIIRITVAKE